MQLCSDLDLLVREPALVRVCLPVATVVFAGQGTVVNDYLQVGSPAWRPIFYRGTLVQVSNTGVTGVMIENDSTGFFVGRYTSFLRPTADDDLPDDYGVYPYMPPGSVSFSLVQFTQIEPACDDVLRMLGMPTSGDAFIPFGQLRQAAVFRALAMIFASAAAMDRTITENSGATMSYTFNKNMAERAAWYDKAFEREIRRLRLMWHPTNDPQHATVAEPSVLDVRRK